MDRWKDVVGYEGLYEVSDTGLVRNYTTKHVLSPSDSGQKLSVTLCNGLTQKSKAVHILVATAFIVNDDPVNKIQVNHKDNVYRNNGVDNLEWITPSGNTLHAYINGHNSKSNTVYQYDLYGNYLASYYSTREAQRVTGISCTSIAAVSRGERKTAGGYVWTYTLPKEKVFMNFAKDLANLSKCEQRGVAAIITDRSLTQVYSIGLNGGPKGLQDCLCKIDSKYGCIHAESQAIAKCTSIDTEKILFVTLSPCVTCASLIVNTGFVKVYYCEEWKDDTGIKILRAAAIQVVKI